MIRRDHELRILEQDGVGKWFDTTSVPRGREHPFLQHADAVEDIRRELRAGSTSISPRNIAVAGGCYTETVAADRPPLERDPVIEAYKRDVDRSLLRERLKKTPAERADDLVRLAQFAEELRRAGNAHREP